MKFKNLSTKSHSDFEKDIRDYWNEIDLLGRSVSEREGSEPFVFYEGPPTANGKPGIHHVISRTLKDYVCRYKTMQGYQVKRKAGWDTHGLPVEIEVEKRLGLKSKQEIEEYGIEEFNQKCRDSVFEYEGMWRDMTEKMGYLIDLDNPYITLDNNYIESLWWILDKYHKEGLIYEGHKILPYCPRCGTGLASHEVAQGYKDIKSNTLTVKFKRKDRDNEYFLAWTTTPWTLVSNVALTVSATETYLKVKQNDEIYYVSKTLAPKVLNEGYEVLEEILGKDLEYIEYEQLIQALSVDKKAFYLTLGDYVTTEDGTGIVHTAPAFGEDDYNLARKYDLPVLQPVDEEGKYVGTPWAGRFVMEDGLDVDIIKYLAKEDKIYKKEKIEHNYPHCWRCQTPLLYYAKPSYYIEVTKYKDKLIENNNGVNWFPDYVGQKRFGNWLENLNDWAISRSRYWGTPLNIWVCENGHKESIGSREELAARAIEEVDPSKVELHRPFVDNIHIECKECGGKMTRVKDVIDCWFDSGAMPFAQHHYPFENSENFDKLFPADYICEGIDQTRGWFYSLLAVSTFVTGKAPYKNVLVNDLILDKDGKKMSKSRGNTVDPFEMFEKYGADVLRWYLLYVSPPWVPTRFDIEGLKEVQSKFFVTLKNVYNFFTLYANTDNIDPRDFFVEYSERAELDRWILSKFNNLVQSITEELESFEVTKTVRMIQDFINDDLSNWYIRRSRRRFWATELTMDKKSVYNTTYELLVGISQMIAPFAPYLSEEIYRNLTGEVSVHLSKYPKVNTALIDEDLEYRMDLAKDFVTLGRASRETAKIKVRQPIARVFVDKKFEEAMGYLDPLIKEELNVKSVEYSTELHSYVDYTLKPNFAVLGKLLGPKLKSFTAELNKLSPYEAYQALEKGDKLIIKLDGEDFEVTKEHVLTNISAKEGFNVETQEDLCIVLDTELNEELINEGFAREFISRIQQKRKELDLEMMDNIEIFYQASDKLTQAIELFKSYIADETLAVSVENQSAGDMTKDVLNGEDIEFMIRKK
ncbi:MAG: isoleucine--tRNA ligase [Peptostreptococcaceae bacterium]|nr:isoleucine--tRNA ligase [Peptostreptococcaceae bacterium]